MEDNVENGSGKRQRSESPGQPPVIVNTVAASVEHQIGASFKVPGGIILTDHIFKVPLDHNGGVQGTIDLFAREVHSPNHQRRNMPFLLYLQGGPGFESPRPTECSGWLKHAVCSFRVILMDQRGTGRSSQITVKNLMKRGTPDQQAQYLSFFRADSIVKDAELVRKSLVPLHSYTGRWSLLGQSYGGFCCVAYMSLAPEGLLEVLMTGGIPPNITLPCSADQVYRATYCHVIEMNRRYYARYPTDVAVVHRIISFLASQPLGGAVLPSGTLLTPRAFQLLGLSGLGASGGFDRLHYLLETFFDGDEVNTSFIKTFESWMSWDTNPLYALLQEVIYCQGAPSNWAAHRIREAEFSKQFDAVEAALTGQPVLFTGEMVYPWMFDDFACLRPYKAVAELLATKADWPLLYNPAVLQQNKAPVAAATYLEDMYVDYQLAQETAQHIRGLRQWVTNEYKHSALRDDVKVFERLLNMVRESILIE